MDISQLAIIVHTKDKDINYSTNQNKIGFLKGTGAKATEFINKENFNKFISEDDTFAYVLSPTTVLYIKKEELLYFKIKDIPF